MGGMKLAVAIRVWSLIHRAVCVHFSNSICRKYVRFNIIDRDSHASIYSTCIPFTQDDLDIESDMKFSNEQKNDLKWLLGN